MWEVPKVSFHKAVGKGLIPAHAGSTRSRSGSSRWAQAHPRSRGEHSERSAEGDPATGSSPLTRGARADFETPIS
ncbi:hypothetical protein HMPREF0307_02206 [Corynebacterium sp. DNF00584]|nr:hypothetical protein HMPREF0307_02206 [Corynebacterium sp. DNF00584]